MVSILPAEGLKVENIEKAFKQIATTYKYFWFLAILESIYVKGLQMIPIRELLAHMVANAWYPAVLSQMEFGGQDKMPEICRALTVCAYITPEMNNLAIYDAVLACMEADHDLDHKVIVLGNFMPYRFLRTFFEEELRCVSDTTVNKQIVALTSPAFCRHG